MSLLFLTSHHASSLCCHCSSSSSSSSRIKLLSFLSSSRRSSRLFQSATTTGSGSGVVASKRFLHRRMSNTLTNKKQKVGALSSASASAMTDEKTIGTHDGSFHCDEALGCYLLQNTRAFAGCKIVRTRDADALAKCGVVIDVGAEYDAS